MLKMRCSLLAMVSMIHNRYRGEGLGPLHKGTEGEILELWSGRSNMFYLTSWILD